MCGNLLGAESVADRLQTSRVRARLETVVEGFISNAFFVELTFGPFMAVDADLYAVRRITAHLDKRRSEVIVDQIEIVMVHAGGLPGVVHRHSFGVGIFASRSFESVALFLSDADEVHTFARGKTRAMQCGVTVQFSEYLVVTESVTKISQTFHCSDA